MDIVELRLRIARGEDLHTDFKSTLGSAEELAKDLVCFANTDGGVLIFGVDDRRAVVGIDDPERLARRIDEAAYDRCEPPIITVTEVLQVDDKHVLVVRIPQGSARPYRTRSGRYYIRTASRCRSASREELLRLFQATQSIFYDATPLYRTTLADLDLAAVDAYLSRVGMAGSVDQDIRRLLRNWRLYDGQHTTLAGLLLFGRQPQLEVPFAQINAARFSGLDSSADPADRTDLAGRLMDVIDQAAAFLRLHLRSPHRIRGFEVERHVELPEEALREAVVNAVAHRDYTVRDPIRLFVLDDRVEIRTPGTTPDTVDASAMRAGVHVPRNPFIYARLFAAGFVTGAGTGIPRMARIVFESTGQDVRIEVRDCEVAVTIPRIRADGDS